MPAIPTLTLIRIGLAAALWFSAAAAACTGGARAAPPAPPAAAEKYARGLLWRIEADGPQPSYLFGTIHSADPRVTALPAAVRAAFEHASSFTMETFFSGAGLVRMAEAMYFPDDRTLGQLLGPEDYALVEQAVAAQGHPTRDLNKKKPWAVVMTLDAPPPESLLFLDLMLQRDAVLAGKPNHKLETMEEQLAVFDGMPLADQVTLLRESVRAHHQMREQHEELIRLYLKRDLAGLLALVNNSKPADDRVFQSLLDRLLTQRNIKMAERMAPRLKEGNAFIAVGAGHLPGEMGLLQLLERAGYRLTAVY